MIPEISADHFIFREILEKKNGNRLNYNKIYYACIGHYKAIKTSKQTCFTLHRSFVWKIWKK